MSEEEKLIKEKIEDLKEYLEYGMKYSEYLDVVNAFEYIENKFKKQQNIINDMAEQLTTPVHNKKWVIDHFTNKYERRNNNANKSKWK